MLLRSVYAIALAVTLSFVTTNNSCQNSGVGTGTVPYLGFEKFSFSEKFNSNVLANTFVDQWDGFVPFRLQYSNAIAMSGTFKPAAGQTLAINTFIVEPWVICKGTTMRQPTVPKNFTVNVNPTNLTFIDSVTVSFPVCSGTTPPGVNTLIAGSEVGFSTEFNGNVPAGTTMNLMVNAKF